MIDSSSKTVSGAWTQILNFVISVVRGYNINPNCVRAAVIRYSNRAEAPIQLTSYGDVNSLVQAIGRIQLLGGGSNLATALDLLRSQVFASSVVRSNTVRIAVIVTDQLQSSSQITTAANNARSQQITIVGVAITQPGRVNVNFFMNSIVLNNWLIQVGDYSQLISGARNTIVTQYGCFIFTTTPAPEPPAIAGKKHINSLARLASRCRRRAYVLLMLHVRTFFKCDPANSTTGWTDRNADCCINTADEKVTTAKNLVNFSPVILKILWLICMGGD